MFNMLFILLIIYIAAREIMFQFERKDLYTRIMSRDIQEYSAYGTNKPPPRKSKSAPVVKAARQFRNKKY